MFDFAVCAGNGTEGFAKNFRQWPTPNVFGVDGRYNGSVVMWPRQSGHLREGEVSRGLKKHDDTSHRRDPGRGYTKFS